MTLHRSTLILASHIIAALASPALADGLQPDFWKITGTPEVNGALAAPQVKMRCMSPEETADLDKTFSPELAVSLARRRQS